MGISGGRIAAIDDLAGAPAARVVDAAGAIVAPGLIDLQARVFARQSAAGAPLDALAGRHGITAWTSAGDVDPEDLPAFRGYSRRHRHTRVYAFVNFDHRAAARDADARRALARLLAEHHDVAPGLVLRFDRTSSGAARPLLDAAIDLLRQAQTRARILCPLPDRADVDALVAGLRPGDILTQVYRDAHTLLPDGRLAPAVAAARNRGVIIDGGPGASGFDPGAARSALDQGLIPDVVSSGQTSMPTATTPELARAMSQFIDLGLSIDQVLAMTTANPARVLGREPHLGTLAPGAPADIVLLKRETAPGGTRIEPVLAVRSGTPLPR